MAKRDNNRDMRAGARKGVCESGARATSASLRSSCFAYIFFLFFFTNCTHLVVGTWWCDGQSGQFGLVFTPVLALEDNNYNMKVKND